MTDCSILITADRGRYHSHFTEEEAEIHNNEVAYLRLLIEEVVEPGFDCIIDNYC